MNLVSMPEIAAARQALPVTQTPFVVVTGGKGGVGKTLLAANLSIELSRRGLRVLLVDLDLGLANLNVLMRLSSARNVEDALCGRCSFADCVVQGPGGVNVLPAGSGTLDMGRPDAARRARLFEGLAGLSCEYDIVLGDSAAGIGPDVLAACAIADRVLVVTTPQPAALTDAYGLIKALHTFGEESGREVPTPELVINQARSIEEAELTATKLRAVCERFLARSPRKAGWMTASASIARSAVTQRLFALGAPGAPGALGPPGSASATGRDRSLALACLTQLAARIEQLCTGPRLATGLKG